jgi:hypothetical protein
MTKEVASVHFAAREGDLLCPDRVTEAERFFGGLVEQAEELPVELAGPFLATLPLPHHVGVDADPDAVVDPCEPSKFLGDGFLGEVEPRPVLLEADVADVGPEQAP